MKNFLLALYGFSGGTGITVLMSGDLLGLILLVPVTIKLYLIGQEYRSSVNRIHKRETDMLLEARKQLCQD